MQTFSVLAVDTSTAACSVALIYNNQTHQRYEVLPQKHAQRLLEMVDEVLDEAGILGTDIDALAYGEGPGAFTGVRIAAGVVQGLALGWDKPVFGISSLEAMAERVLSESILTEPACATEVLWCALMDARMKEVYIQTGTFNIEHNTWQASEPCLVSPEEAKERIHSLAETCIGLGDVKNEYPALTGLFSQWFDTLPAASAVAQIFQRVNAGDDMAYQALALPVYLRNSVADTIAERAQKKLKKQN